MQSNCHLGGGYKESNPSAKGGGAATGGGGYGSRSLGLDVVENDGGLAVGVVEAFELAARDLDARALGDQYFWIGR